MLALALAALAVAAARAETIEIAPGRDWAAIAAAAKPGDEIVLLEGPHRPARIEGLAGEPGRPIVIRASHDRTLARITPEAFGLELVGARHVEVRNLFVDGATGTAISAVEGRDVTLRNCLLIRSGVGVELRRVAEARLAGLRIEGFSRRALVVDGCRELAANDLQILARGDASPDAAIEVSGGSVRCVFDRIAIAQRGAVAFALGLAPGTAAASDPAAPLAEGISIRRSTAERPKTFAAFGSVRGVEVERNTALDCADGVYRLDEPPAGWTPARDIRIRANLFAWQPGAMARFAGGSSEAAEGAIVLGANLWHSRELPAARSLLGPMPGRIEEPQVLAVDPDFDNGYRPQAPAARGFGHTADDD